MPRWSPGCCPQAPGPGSWFDLRQLPPSARSESGAPLTCPPRLGPGFSRVTEMTASLGFSAVPSVGISLAALGLSGLQTPRCLSLLGGRGPPREGGALALKSRSPPPSSPAALSLLCSTVSEGETTLTCRSGLRDQ